MDADVPVVESGGKADFAYGGDKSMHFAPAHVDRVLHDGDTVSLGGTVLTAHLTAGHTKGTTTWTLDEPQDGRMLHVVIVGSPNVNGGYRLVKNQAYPQIAMDYKRGFAVLRALPCDIFLGAHGRTSGWLRSMRAGRRATKTPLSILPATRLTWPSASRRLKRRCGSSQRRSGRRQRERL